MLSTTKFLVKTIPASYRISASNCWTRHEICFLWYNTLSVSSPNQQPEQLHPPAGTVVHQFPGDLDGPYPMRPFQYNESSFAQIQADEQSNAYWTDLMDADEHGPYRQLSGILLEDGTFFWGEDIPTHAALQKVSGNSSPICAYLRVTPRERTDERGSWLQQVVTIDPDIRSDEQATSAVQQLASFVASKVDIRDDKLQLVIYDAQPEDELPPERFRGSINDYLTMQANNTPTQPS